MASRTYNVLLVDDNPAIHEDFKSVLSSVKDDLLESMESDELALFNTGAKAGDVPIYNLYSCYQGQDVIPVISDFLKKDMHFTLAFVDIRMPPGWDGIATIEQIWKIDPNIQVVICTAHSDYSWENIISRLGYSDKFLILKKPFDNVEVRQLAASLSTKWDLDNKVREKIKDLNIVVDDKTKSLEKSITLIEATLNAVPTGVIAVDKDRMITHHNERFKEMFNIQDSEFENGDSKAVIEHIANQCINPEAYKKRVDEIWDNNLSLVRDELFMADGRIIERYSQQHMIHSNSFGRVISFNDITDMKKVEERLLYDSMHDTLTGLTNRRYFNQAIQDASKEGQANQTGMAVILLDLDRFKYVNDSLGHQVGDELLFEVSKRLLRESPANAIVSRLGGDEFTVLIKGIKDKTALTDPITHILDSFKNPFVANEFKLPVSISMGVKFVEHTDKISSIDVMRQADIAMYQAKKMGGNTFKIYDEKIDNEISEHIAITSALRDVVSHRDFYLCYQPVVDAKNNKILGVEALIRWKHPTLGLLPPTKFISLSEEMGSIIDITTFVLRTACAQVKNWQYKGLPPLVLNVNLSGKQLNQNKTMDMIKNILEETDFDPKYLVLEMTEGIFLENSIIVKNTMDQIKELGIRIAIDDFGTGYSSLKYLKNFPIDILKIDQSFVSCIESNPDDVSIVVAIISMAHNLGLTVVAEGVETKGQMNFLKLHRCDELQGFYLSHPLEVDKCFDVLKKGVIDPENPIT